MNQVHASLASIIEQLVLVGLIVRAGNIFLLNDYTNNNELSHTDEIQR
jgi:hypothetical protein